MANKQWFTWTVEFKVYRTWVEDGFDLTDDRAKDMIENDLTYSHGSETKAKVLSAPDADEIAKAQGYKDAAERRKQLEPTHQG